MALSLWGTQLSKLYLYAFVCLCLAYSSLARLHRDDGFTHSIQQNKRITEIVNDRVSLRQTPSSPLNCPHGAVTQSRSTSSNPNLDQLSHANSRNPSSIKIVSSSNSKALFDSSNSKTAACKGKTQQVRVGDTCAGIIYLYFGNSLKRYKTCNPEFNCFYSRLKIGMSYCVCTSPSPPNSNSTPITPSPNDSPSTSIPPIQAPLPENFDSRVLFLNAPIPQLNKNMFFRYASYGFRLETGSVDKFNWVLLASKDWTDLLGPVEDQKECNACWAMASGAAVDALLSIATASLSSVSKQQLLDCSVVPNNGSCGGGWPTDAFEYMVTKGVASTRIYQFVGNQQKCYGQNNPSFHSFKIAAYEEIDFYGSFGLILAVQNQPVVVNIQASSKAFQEFKGEKVFDREDCFTSGVDHSVLVVGYDLTTKKSPKPFWILRNSWGTSWGEKGYMRIAYTGGDGVCGMHTTPAYYPVLLPSSMVSGFLQTPCGPPNPCGGGDCSLNPITGKIQCKCPETFVAVQNKDETQTCAPSNPCETKSYNPCGYGTCVNDLLGSYTCICPPGFIPDTFSNVNQSTCRPATSSDQSLVYVVQPENTCELIWKTFRLSQDQFLSQNQELNCTSLNVGTTVNVTQSVDWKNCRVTYSWNMGDSCKGIQSLFNISRDDLSAMNPDLDCSNMLPGIQMCVQLGSPVDYVPPCGQFYTIQYGDTCKSIIEKKNIDPFVFFIFNRGINCQYLTPQSSETAYLDRVCIDSQYLGTSKCNGKSMTVARFDTCERIVYNFFGRSLTKFKKCNKQLPCRGLVPGTPYCICN